MAYALESTRLEIPTFKFRPLESKKEEIRLIDLLPGQFDEPIICRIHHALLNRPPPFSMLSYTWGTTVYTKSVAIDGAGLMVTSTLDAALRHLRHTTRHRTLWVDNICINMSDLDERSDQIGLMSSICKKAENTIVWLGDDDKHVAEGVFDTLDCVSGAKDFLDVDQSPLDAENVATKLVILIFENNFESPIRRALSSQIWSGIVSLVTRSWWTRVWTLQDVLLAKAATVVWGRHSISWEACTRALVRLSRCFPNHPRRIGNLIENYKVIRFPGIDFQFKSWELGKFQQAIILASYCQSPKASKRPFLQLLSDFWPLHSSDPRDKVYALQSLLSDSREKVPVDYSKDFWTIYADAVCTCIVTSGSFEVLGHCEMLDDYRESLPSIKSRRPSWVPDWTSEGYQTMMSKYGSTLPLRLHDVKDVMIEDSVYSVPTLGGFDAHHSRALISHFKAEAYWRCMALS